MAEVELDREPMLAELKKLNMKIKQISSEVNDITDGGKKTNFSDDEKAQLMSIRSNFLSAMFQANTIHNVFKTLKNQLAAVINAATTTFNQIVQRCITLLSQFNSQLSIDSVTVTLGISPTVAVTLK